jgi:hypothetical protein
MIADTKGDWPQFRLWPVASVTEGLDAGTMEHDTSRLDSTRDHGTRELGLSPSVPPSMPSPMPNPMPSQAAAMQVGLTELPPVTTTRWVTRRKAAVVAAVREGVLTLDEACRRYHLSVEEFTSWQRLVDRHGLPGLRATRIQEYRQPSTGD